VRCATKSQPRAGSSRACLGPALGTAWRRPCTCPRCLRTGAGRFWGVVQSRTVPAWPSPPHSPALQAAVAALADLAPGPFPLLRIGPKMTAARRSGPRRRCAQDAISVSLQVDAVAYVRQRGALPPPRIDQVRSLNQSDGSCSRRPRWRPRCRTPGESAGALPASSRTLCCGPLIKLTKRRRMVVTLRFRAGRPVQTGEAGRDGSPGST
jgi:hypothetical protein